MAAPHYPEFYTAPPDNGGVVRVTPHKKGITVSTPDLGTLEYESAESVHQLIRALQLAWQQHTEHRST